MPYTVRKGPTFGLPKTRLFYYGTNSVQFIFVFLSYAIIFTIHYLNSKKKKKKKKKKIKNIGDIACECLI